MLSTYLTVALGFTLVNGVFIAVFVGLFLDVTIPRATLVGGAALIALFAVVGSIVGVWRRPLTLAVAEKMLEQTLGRVFLLHLAVFVGVFLAAVVGSWFVWPFIVLKSITDVGPVSYTHLTLPTSDLV